jgi:5-methyltetrahydrofolate--homocysteine methyltransferase
VGGAPITPEFAAEIGADGYGEDAMSAVEVATRLLGK